jgi:biotin transport system substrate-specific component
MSTTQKISLPGLLDRSGQNTIAQILWIVSFAALTAIGARVEIPSQPVPYTLQTFFVLLSGAMLGARNGAISQLAYLAVGALGAPVFAAGGVGLATLLGPTGGYLLAFPVAAAAVGYFVRQKQGLAWSFLAMALGLVVIFTLGMVQLNVVYFHDWSASFKSGFLLFSLWDVLKLSAAAMIYHEIAKRWRKLPG